MHPSQRIYELVGIGLGPANLSTAALLHKCANTDIIFLEQKENFSWHKNMLFDFSNINVNFYKDLVTLIDPTNPFSFMNYLVSNNKQYSFFNSSFERVSRAEFGQYFYWVAQNLPYVLFSITVNKIEYKKKNKLFAILTSKGIFFAKNILIGTGIEPKLPEWVHQDEEYIFHGYNFLLNRKNFDNENILVIGGGQSSAEIIYSLLENERQIPSHIYWVTKKGYPVILDENPFANEVYTPSFANFFYHLDDLNKHELCRVLRDTSDGIHATLLTKIYQRLYFFNKVKGISTKLSLLPLSSVDLLEKYDYTESNIHVANNNVRYKATISGVVNKVLYNINRAIFCTGFAHKSFKLLERVENYYEGKIEMEEDFSVRSVYNKENKIFVNNGAKVFFGPADPNLSLLSWRSAKIINSLLKNEIYKLPNDEEMIYWGKGETCYEPALQRYKKSC